jgi:hypothetical protein
MHSQYSSRCWILQRIVLLNVLRRGLIVQDAGSIHVRDLGERFAWAFECEEDMEHHPGVTKRR